MALYNLPDGVDVPIWPDGDVTLLGAPFWTVDNTPGAERITSNRAQTAIVTASYIGTAWGLSGGDQTVVTMGLRIRDDLDAPRELAINSLFLNRDVDQAGSNVAMVVLFLTGWYFDVILQQDGIAVGLTNVDITTTLQFWTLDF